MKIYLATFALMAAGCTQDKGNETRNIRCSLKPEVGVCRAAFPRYFFNDKAESCDEFIWGGCKGVVPFETKKSCVEICQPTDASLSNKDH